MNMKKNWKYYLFGLYIIVSLFYLTKYPTGWVDDCFYTLPAYHYSQTGSFDTDSNLNTYQFKGVMIGRMFYTIKSQFIEIFGLSLFSERLPGFIFSIITLLLIYKIAKQLFGSRVATTATIMMALWNSFVFLSHDGRPSAMLLLFEVWLFYCLIQPKIDWLLVGILVGCSFDIHPCAIYLLFISIAIMIYRREVKNSKWFWYILVVYGLIWLYTHVVQNIGVFAIDWQTFHSNQMPNGYYGLKRVLFVEYHRYISFFWDARWHRNIILLPILIGTLFYGYKKRKSFRTAMLFIPIVIFPFFLAFFAGNPSTIYMFLVAPFIFILTARAYERHQKLLIFLILFFLCEFGYTIYTFRDSNYQGYIDKVCQYIPKGSRVLGDPAYWVGMKQAGMDYYYAPQNCQEKTFEAYKTEYILFNAHSFWWRDGADTNRDYLFKNYDLVDIVTDTFYGRDNLWTRGSFITEIWRKK